MKPRLRRRRGRFLKGPVPWGWIERAGTLPGKALYVGVALWHESGMKKTRTVTLPTGKLIRAGVHRCTIYRGLAQLESAGLVAVDRKPGRYPVVTILDAGPDSADVV